MKKSLLIFALLTSLMASAQQVQLTVDAHQTLGEISPWIYGKNNSISDDPFYPTTEAAWSMYRDAGLRMYRENGGNNSTKYNWKLKLSSHPDWYNNVYSHDWDFSAATLLDKTSNTQGLYGLQILGKVAATKSYNFDDYAYNQSRWWGGVGQNLAGGGIVNPDGSKPALKEGNPDLYLKDWPADSTVGIFDHWFNNLNLDASRLQYWNMDNEPDIWSYTHNDVITGGLTAEEFIQKYFAVAKAARKKFPNVKLLGPVVANEWFWYLWDNKKVVDPKDNTKSYPYMEYFIKRIAEEQKATGIRLLDVLDFHFYAGSDNDITNTLQVHRVYYDTTYHFPYANGTKTLNGGWDESLNKEYIFERSNQWLNKYMGSNHNVKLSLTENGSVHHGNPNVVTCWYASTLGVFAERGVEIYTPWDWYTGQWEVLHLFSNYFGTRAVKTTSSLDSLVSGYSALSAKGDSLMIALVNRDQNGSRDVTINLKNFITSTSVVNGYQLAGLPGTETFVSKTNNALKKKSYAVSGNQLSITIPQLSVTMIQIPAFSPVTSIEDYHKNHAGQGISLYPNPAKNKLAIEGALSGNVKVIISDVTGRISKEEILLDNNEVDISNLDKGQYIIRIITADKVSTHKFIKE
ncbi:glycoside hydrolase family 44 protein [Sporocytophaga myxococcoides]|uniref:glycoside hydrolase family 44 protein n=1 Tax=Sporocytophaga myxococcoides TaxID=153721 RepID=UPI000401C129|nr:glycoside hydrolase family 44 protein [Sporocytophaga myxococcoides]